MAAEMAFKQLKEALTSLLVLCLPNFSQRFVVEYDASGVDLSVIITQNNCSVIYLSEALKGSALTFFTYKKEMLVIVKAIKKWCSYLLVKPFIVHTNQKSLKYLLEQWITTPTCTMAAKLLGYYYEIKYKWGLENQDVDSLSHVVEFWFLSISLPFED